jgi:two-component system chemotaxis response regulator CheB
MLTKRVAIVDDATFVREALKRLLADDPRIRVVGAAATGEELLDNLDRWRPDVVTLDLNMPGMGGLATLDRLMEIRPLPVIILSTHSGKGAPLTVEALSRGAADFIDKEAFSLVDFRSLREALLEKIVEVSCASRPLSDHTVDEAHSGSPADESVCESGRRVAFDVAVIGASTGGPRAIERVLRALPPDLPVPIAVVQHMPPGFTRAFAERLDRTLPLSIREAEHGDPLVGGTVLIAPAGKHMTVVQGGEALAVALGDSPDQMAHCPSVDVLFDSVSRVVGARGAAVLLTGMGRDGAEGMTQLARAGGHTIAQDEASCIVYGMPRAAVLLGGARETIHLDRIGVRLKGLLAAA